MLLFVLFTFSLKKKKNKKKWKHTFACPKEKLNRVLHLLTQPYVAVEVTKENSLKQIWETSS